MDEQSYGRIIKLIRETVIMLCKNGVHFDHYLKVQGLIGVTVDDGNVFLIHMNDCVNGDGYSSADTSKPAESSGQTEASSHQLHADAVNEQVEAETRQWSKTPAVSTSLYSEAKQERGASKAKLHAESQNSANSPALVAASLSFVQQNKFWDPIKDDDDVICVESASTANQTSVDSTSAASAAWNPYQYSVEPATGQLKYDVSDTSSRKICQIAKTQGSYTPVHSDTSQSTESLGIKTEYREMGVTHYLSPPKSQLSRIGSSQRRNMVIVLCMYMVHV